MEKNYAIIIPAQNEEAVIGSTIDQLRQVLPSNCYIAVGLNNCTDQTRAICEERGVIVGETSESGYGWGCQTAIDAADREIKAEAYLFFAADGANDPQDALKLIKAYESSDYAFVMGIRKFQLTSWFAEFGRSLPNLLLGIGCKALGGQFFHDLGPLRLINKQLFRRLKLSEMVWGWTIEAQIKAGLMKVSILPTPVAELPRQAGEQKISGVSLIRSCQIGLAIFKAAVRSRKAWFETSPKSSHALKSSPLRRRANPKYH